MKSKKQKKISHRSLEAHLLEDPLFRQRRMKPKDEHRIKHKHKYYEERNDADL